MPAISVLVPVYDAAPWLASSLASLWRPSEADFEVIAIDDGSSDDSAEILERIAGREARLTVVRTPHRGLPAALNTVLARARAPLVARHDADDLSHRRRFEWQRATLDSRADIAVVGGRIRMFPAAETGLGMRRWARWHNALLGHEAMANEVLIDSPLAHGTAMIRREWLERVGGWQERGWAEDLDLWVRLLRAGARFEKRPETLYGWRQHRGSATRRDPRYRRERFVALKLEALARDFLAGRREALVIGTGESLARACRELADRGIAAQPIAGGRPSAGLLARLSAPAVLVFTSPEARARWRSALLAAGWRERRDFIFVA
jgi:glycosyltransferase involved in cell wall biosynthesis